MALNDRKESFYTLTSFPYVKSIKFRRGKKRMISVYTKNIGSVWFGVACDEQRVFGTSFAVSEQEALRCLLSGIPFNVSFQVFQEPSAFAEDVLASVKNVYDGKDATHGFPLATEHLPAYTRRVLEAASLIPAGYVASYGSIAKAAGGSPRAVGNVMAGNPFAPIVPCHRVVSSDFTIGRLRWRFRRETWFFGSRKTGNVSLRGRFQLRRKETEVFPVEFVLGKTRKRVVM